MTFTRTLIPILWTFSSITLGSDTLNLGDYMSNEDRVEWEVLSEINRNLGLEMLTLKNKLRNLKGKVTYRYYYGCADGWDSPSLGKSGACSSHGGVVSYTYCVKGCENVKNIKTLNVMYRYLKGKTGQHNYTLGRYSRLNTDTSFTYNQEIISKPSEVRCLTNNKPLLYLKDGKVLKVAEYDTWSWIQHITEWSEEVDLCLGYQPYQD